MCKAWENTNLTSVLVLYLRDIFAYYFCEPCETQDIILFLLRKAVNKPWQWHSWIECSAQLEWRTQCWIRILNLVYNSSVAGFQQWVTFPWERQGPSAPTVIGLVEVLSHPWQISDKLIIIVINNRCQGCVLHEGLLPITRVTFHVLFRNKSNIGIRLT